MEEKTISRSGISLGDIPVWSWLAATMLLLAFFMIMSSSGDLLIPYVGQLAGATDYLHEFAHDGRHLLGLPCH
ncbi:MAG: CbtB-domain containing protein [Rubrobacter sp.]|jgi:hypothetical protein|nr:CbtB-domain containing protein [Rubrobacter sp.]